MKSMIDMSKASSTYLVGLGLLALVSMAMNNFPQLAPSHYYVIFFQRQLTGLFFALGVLAGALAIHRHSARGRAPWQVPQSQVSILYAVFFVLTLAGIIVSR